MPLGKSLTLFNGSGLFPCSSSHGWLLRVSYRNVHRLWARLTNLGPFYLVRKERIPEAREVVRKLARPGYRTERMIDAQIELLKQANEMEKINAANSSFRDCFRGVNTKRTMIGLMCWLIQQTNGETLTSYATLCESLLMGNLDPSDHLQSSRTREWLKPKLS
jgi:hypothetical protein